ncbi:hypothetical protein FXE48_12250 [Vibrio cholerae]|nr:hypothetical protein [Vibrio cholerae]PAR86515.1 hypothetical protein CGT83_17345 [Vibrio cholerae]PAR99234.1 hypothetical protein CGT79_12465 [Vibrio cholerae]PAS24703.1 hypothetical protein CGT73_03065 [Vibrio cholerae]RNE80656.1 hypothetical protein EEJ35_18320 [Vibrio cholerae]
MMLANATIIKTDISLPYCLSVTASGLDVTSTQIDQIGWHTACFVLPSFCSILLSKGRENMLSRDWFDTLVVVAWVGIWSALIYLLPFAGV